MTRVADPDPENPRSFRLPDKYVFDLIDTI
jgi:hypothetical protein